MEKLTLTPQSHELIVNNGAVDGAVDLFSYGPDTAADLKPLGCLYVVGYRETDSNNMGYMVSLIAALARREYYAQIGQAPRDAFIRTLKRINEVVEEFFQSSGVNLSVGIFAIAGANMFVSKLDKFKILLAREGQVIDIMNNVMLFQKEHLQKKQFSSIISGTVQPGDRILAYYPSKPVVSRERFLKSYLLKLPYEEMADKISDIGRQHATFATALMYVDMVQTAEEAYTNPPVATEPMDEVKKDPSPAPTAGTDVPTVNLAWKPRQSRTSAVMPSANPGHGTPELEQEVPKLIPTEFALGLRDNSFSRWMKKMSIVRLDTRGKMIFLASAVILVVLAALVAKSVLFTSAEEKELKQALHEISADLKLAQDKVSAQENGSARQILVRALSSLTKYNQENSSVRDLSASILRTMDDLDNAKEAAPSLIAQLDADNKLTLVVWASASNSIWTVTTADSKYFVSKLVDGETSSVLDLEDLVPSIILPFKDGVVVIDPVAHKMARVFDAVKTFDIPTQDAILSAYQFDDNVYLLTDRSILKVSDLDTNKPVTKQWLSDVNDLAVGAMRMYIDGNIYTLGRDGTLTTYYKGKKTVQVKTPIEPSGTWELIPANAGRLAIANADTRRIYELDITSGELITTLKLDAQVSLLQMTAGPDNSVLVVTKDNKLWKIE